MSDPKKIEDLQTSLAESDKRARIEARLNEYEFVAQMVSGIEKEDWYRRRVAELRMMIEKGGV